MVFDRRFLITVSPSTRRAPGVRPCASKLLSSFRELLANDKDDCLEKEKPLKYEYLRGLINWGFRSSPSSGKRRQNRGIKK
jgi:hypothetical protein